MTAIDFPDEPDINDLFTVGEQAWRWTGVYWRLIATPGAQGEPGAGVAVGGTTGQVLTKASSTNYDTTWTDGAVPLGYGDIDGGSADAWYSWLDLKVDNSDANAIILDGAYVNGGSAVN